MFWEPGGVLPAGVTGLAQLLATIVRKWFNFSIALPFVSLSTTDLFFNRDAAFFPERTVVCVSMESHWPSVHFFHVLGGHFFDHYDSGARCADTAYFKDPIVCGIFGAVVNGLGTGFALQE